jgi:uncharacterized membrane protein YphA (DoxX/SURF4 family)
MKKSPYDQYPGNIIIRLMVGLVFLSEGIQKFLFPAIDGIGRFIKLGIPDAKILAPTVGAAEIICGILVIIGLRTKLAVIPLLIIIIGAIYFTKVPSFIHKGFWPTVHDGRADFSMLMGLIFLLICGSGKYAADNAVGRRRR